MARTINHVTLLGRVGAAPELRQTKSGTAVVQLRLATDRYSKSADAQSETDWHSIVVWAKTAEAVARYVGKGDRVHVTGRLQQHSWQTESGERRNKVEVHASEVIFLDSRNDRNGHDDPEDGGDSPF